MLQKLVSSQLWHDLGLKTNSSDNLVGVGVGGPLMMIGDAMTPFTVDVTVFEVKFDVTVTMVSI